MKKRQNGKIPAMLLSVLWSMWLFLAACGAGGGESSEPARVGLKIHIPPAIEKVSASGKMKSFAPSRIAAIIVRVSGGDGQGLASARVAVSPGEEVTLHLDVPAGPARKFTVLATDEAGTVLFQGEASADLTPGLSASLSILMAPVNVGATGTLSIDPAALSVPAGRTAVFTAVFSGPADPALVWSVNEIPGGNAAVGTITPTGPATATYTAPAGLSDSDQVTVKVSNAANPAVSAAAAVTLLPLPAPVMKINSPSDGALVKGAVQITATAEDPDGVVRVEFSLDGNTPFFTGTAAPYRALLPAQISDGTHTLAAALINGNHLQSALDSIRITVDNTGPSISITSPRNNAILGCGAFTVIANAADPNGVAQVDFFFSNGGADTLIAPGAPLDANGNFGASWKPAANGGFTLKAVATDKAGNRSTSTAGVTYSCVSSIQVSPQTVVVAKDQTQAFTIGPAPSSVVWSADAGTITSSGVYTPPGLIPTDTAGMPKGAIVEAVSTSNPNARDTASVTLVTGLALKFDPSVPVASKIGPVATDSSGQRSIAFDKGNVVSVWASGTNILFSESADGLQWSAPSFVAQGREPVSQAALAVGPDGTIYVIYRRLSPAGLSTVEMARRVRGAKLFETWNLLGPVSPSAQDPTIAVSPKGEIVYVAWAANMGKTGLDILFQRIDPEAGKPIDAAPRNLTEGNGDFQQSQPVLAAAPSGPVYLTWVEQGTVMATASVDRGAAFLTPTQVNDRPGNVGHPTLAADSEGRALVAWEDDSDSDKAFFVLFDAGKIDSDRLAFGTDVPVGLAGRDSIGQSRPSLGVDGAGGIYIGLQETLAQGEDGGIFLYKSRDGGGAFTLSPIDDDRTIAPNKFFPSLAVDGAGRAFAIWTDGRNNPIDKDLFFARGE